MKEPFCSPQHKWNIPSGATSKWFGASQAAKAELEMVQDVGGIYYRDLAQCYHRRQGRGYPTRQTWGQREGGCPPKGLTDPTARHGERSVDREVPKCGT